MYAVIIQEVHAVLILLERGKYNIANNLGFCIYELILIVNSSDYLYNCRIIYECMCGMQIR